MDTGITHSNRNQTNSDAIFDSESRSRQRLRMSKIYIGFGCCELDWVGSKKKMKAERVKKRFA
jgi:hypothetical protein